MNVEKEGIQVVEDAFIALICFILSGASSYCLRDWSFVASFQLDYKFSTVRTELIQICFL